MGNYTMNANVANKPIMPKKENMARIPSLASGESMPIMADITDMTNTTITPTRANTPIMPDIANMARAPIVPKVGTIPDTENMSDTRNMPDDRPRMANMVRLPRLEDVPGISNHFTLPLSKPPIRLGRLQESGIRPISRRKSIGLVARVVSSERRPT
jgi:hypothetical protein